MPPYNSNAIGSSVAGRAPLQPPWRAPTFSSLFRVPTGKKEKSPKVKTKEVFIPKYELEWDSLKEWLDTRFAHYKCTFTKRFNVVRSTYATCKDTYH